jgi:hypothetical protein
MINAGLMEWVTQHVLLPDDSMSEYSREYGTALLMNLSLRTNGKMRCEANSLNVLASLCNLLESENGQVRTYVNGTLYSLLSRSALIHAAKEMGMEGILTEIRDQAQETFQRQIDCILQQLRSEGDEGDEGEYSDDEDEVADQDDENEEEEEEDDEEVEEDELLSLEHSGLRGEELLCSSYLADGENASSQVQAASQSIAVRADERAIHPGPNNHYDIDSEMSLPQRPITPGQGLGRTNTSNSGHNDHNNMSTSTSTGEQKQAQEQKGEEFIAPANINTGPEQEDGFKSHKQLLRSPQGQSRQTFFPTAENQEEQEERQYSQQQFQDNLPQHLQGQLEGFEGFSAEDAKEEAVDLVPPLGQTKHSASKRKIPPPKVGNEDDADGNHNDEAYYNAFRSRSNVGRTPVSSAFAESGEFG